MTVPRPRRVSPTSPIGTLLKQAKPPASLVRQAGADDDRQYIKLIQQCPCLHCGMDPCYEAAHVKLSDARFGKSNMLGKRPKARFTLPLCPDHHRLARDCQHHQGEQMFWDALGIDPVPTCELLYAKRGDLVAMRAVVMVVISNRSKS